MHLDIGSPVMSSDGQQIGKVDRIVFEAETLRMREFVVHKGPFFTTDRIVQRAVVHHIDDEHTVHLRVTADEAEQLPPFVAEQHQSVFAGGGLYAEQPTTMMTAPGSMPRDAVILSHGSDVYDQAGKHIGRLDQVVYEQDGVAGALVVDAGRIFTHEVKIPVSEIHSIRHDRIELAITAEELSAITTA